MSLRYLSVCSGIEAATQAWHPLGWQPVAFSEIEPFPCAVLAHHYPHVPNWGDMTRYPEWPDADVDVLCGGTPCQSFSVAGLRKGLADPRGNLMLTFGAIAARYRPEWLVWENVPGVLSSNGGRDFGTFLGMLAELGYGFAYRVLDAQYFGVAQRRRRVFVVANARNWVRAAAVLFERESLSGHPAPRRSQGEEPAKCLTRGVGQRFDPETETLPVAFGWQNSASQGDRVSADVTPTLDKSKTPAVAFDLQQITSSTNRSQLHEYSPTMAKGSRLHAVAFGGDLARTLSARHDSSPCADRGMDVVGIGSAVRRLTPRECERLQGFPDDYTLVPHRGKPAADGPRYKALGNSMAVPVMRWIGERIQHVNAILEAAE